MATTTDPKGLKLGYMVISSPIPNIYVGGLMVTDGRGLPVEFRYTEPIQPTKIQQVLYGQVLSNYIKQEVILETLVKSTDGKFKCLIVEDEQLMDYTGKCPPLHRLTETKSSPLGSVGTTETINEDEVLLQTNPSGSPIRLFLSDKAKSNSEGEESGGGAVYNVLFEAGSFMDVQEPLKRITKALEIICQEAGISSQTS